LWNAELPNIRPFYAVKCNNLEPIISTLRDGGTGFDCASSDEFSRVRGSTVIYANPCKAKDELIKAQAERIQMTTFDTGDELEKITDIIDDAIPILRIHVDDKGGSRIPLNKKFGMSLKDATKLQTKNSVYGLAFHVGSDCTSVDSYMSAFDTVRQFLHVFKDKPFFYPSILDIGGGFSGRHEQNGFFRDKIAPLIRKEVSTLPFQTVIAEPGRFFAESACTLQVPIIGRKTLPCGTDSITVDDSVYGIFSGVLFDGFRPSFRCLTRGGSLKYFTIFGRTCDSADKIAERVLLPVGCRDGDILQVDDIGAYSYASASEFNGFPRPQVQVLL
jgi:ornithine decarboxylase